MKFYPSHADTWMLCPASAWLRTKYPTPDSTLRQESIQAHQVAADWIMNGLRATLQPPLEYRNAVEQYVTAIRGIAGDHKVMVEEEYPANILGDSHKVRIDAYFYDSKSDVLHIWDAKFGFKPVDVFLNWQLLIEAISLTDFIGFGNTHLHIVQPRTWHPDGVIRTWKLRRNDLCQYRAKIALRVNELLEIQSKGLDAPQVTGDHCRLCSAFLFCDSIIEASLNAVDVAYKSFGVNHDPYRLSIEYRIISRALELLQHRFAKLQQAGIYAGGLPGYEVTQGKGNLNWKGGEEEKIKSMARFCGVEITKESLITPNQAINAGMPETIVNNLSERTGGSKKLQPIRKNTKIQEIFKNAGN